MKIELWNYSRNYSIGKLMGMDGSLENNWRKLFVVHWGTIGTQIGELWGIIGGQLGDYWGTTD